MKKIKQLLGIMKTLRSPGGCPWDLKQTHESILSHMIEEAYETQEAALKKNWDHFREELGDLLFQVVFHSQMASEKGWFDFHDVCDGISKKLIHRHPHVFKKTKKTKVKTADDVLKNWEQLKQEEKKGKAGGLLGDMPVAVPALWKAYRIGQKVGQVGFEFPNMSSAMEKVEEELGEWKKELGKKKRENKKVEEEFGDLLFSLVNVSRFLKINPELALQKANQKFTKRFQKVEKLVKKKGLNFKQMSIPELDQLWNEVKSSLKRSPR